MKGSVLLSVAVLLVPVLSATETADRAMQLVSAGDAASARSLLAQAARANPADPVRLREYAEFLERFGDPEARTVYRRVLDALGSGGDAATRQAAAERLAVLELLAGDSAGAAKAVSEYRAAGGAGLNEPPSGPVSSGGHPTVEIPGPLRSFSRMAAISRAGHVSDVLGAVARNVVTNGYQASHSNDALDQTEYLKLVIRYLAQARELEKLAGESKMLRVPGCESAEAGELLRILGFRMRGGCGAEVVLETVNASRAFLTTDSGFPVADLEQALRTNRPFEYDFRPTEVPVLYGPDYWTSDRKDKGEPFIDILLSDPSLCRLYLGFSKLDPDTATALKDGIPVARIRAFAHVLDFFGGMFEIRNGKAMYPGGARAAGVWADLVGAHPDKGAEFYEKLLSKDDGWLASLYDALMRIEGPAQAYLTDPDRLKRFYTAVRGRITSPGPARPVFRSNTDMMLLTTRLHMLPNGQPHIPGSVQVWRNLFVSHPHGKYDGKLTKLAQGWKEPDDVLEALFALSRKAVENEPLKIFMAVSDLDRRRKQPLADATVDRLAREYRIFGQQYVIFNDAPAVRDETIIQFLDTAQSLSKIRNQNLRSDAIGTMQALVSLWQILSRQGALPEEKTDTALSGILSEFSTKVSNSRDVFDGGRNGIKLLLTAAGAEQGTDPQARLLDLLAGSPGDAESHGRLVQQMNRVLESQRMVSLTLILELADHLESVAGGQEMNNALLTRLASRVAEISLPRAPLTSAEKNAYAFGYWTEKHIDEQRKTNLRAVVERARGDAEKLREARGLLAPFLRDILVAYSYAYYAPPGAQILYTNPLFVRGHDFLGVQGANQTWRQTETFGSGWPANAGGRLLGSLTGLPYALADAEQNFLIPTETQALIWGDLVPQMMLSAKLPRWSGVSGVQLHWVGLHLRYARHLLAKAAIHPAMRQALLETLSSKAPPRRTHFVARALESGDAAAAADAVLPAELYLLGLKMASTGDAGDPFVTAIRQLAASSAPAVTEAAISRAFGTPKPTLANSYQPELLNLRTFPTLMGYSSRIMAESWESNTLYWAALADELHIRPSQLNLLIPEWTQQVVERIFASHLEDWPALLYSLRTVGDDVRAKTRQTLSASLAGSADR
ncbi:MAG: hypothetical protein IPM24_24380 [Bryobacterales bacterium]|nr:hypothetical protein [Bryobacterales bacterium]